MTTRDIVYISLFAAFIAALGVVPPLAIPLAGGVPITAQSMGCMIAGGVLGAKRGALAVSLFLLLVGIGFPLLAGARGGLGILSGPAGGFYAGWVIAAWVVGGLMRLKKQPLRFSAAFIASSLGGIVALYPLGILWLSASTSLSLIQAALYSLTFVPGDLIKAAAAAKAIVLIAHRSPQRLVEQE